MRIKPIQATPELSGKDAAKLIEQTNMKPTQAAINKNKMLRSVLERIRR